MMNKGKRTKRRNKGFNGFKMVDITPAGFEALANLKTTLAKGK